MGLGDILGDESSLTKQDVIIGALMETPVDCLVVKPIASCSAVKSKFYFLLVNKFNSPAGCRFLCSLLVICTRKPRWLHSIYSWKFSGANNTPPFQTQPPIAVAGDKKWDAGAKVRTNLPCAASSHRLGCVQEGRGIGVMVAYLVINLGYIPSSATWRPFCAKYHVQVDTCLSLQRLYPLTLSRHSFWEMWLLTSPAGQVSCSEMRLSRIVALR